MAKQVKMITKVQASELEKIINDYLSKGWKLKGGLVSHNCNLVATVYKK